MFPNKLWRLESGVCMKVTQNEDFSKLGLTKSLCLSRRWCLVCVNLTVSGFSYGKSSDFDIIRPDLP